jgi:hypothetical protein
MFARSQQQAAQQSGARPSALALLTEYSVAKRPKPENRTQDEMPTMRAIAAGTKWGGSPKTRHYGRVSASLTETRNSPP